MGVQVDHAAPISVFVRDLQPECTPGIEIVKRQSAATTTPASGSNLWGMYQWLDRALKWRDETGLWWRRHDEYNKAERTGLPLVPSSGSAECLAAHP
jgi:hypothetical protein